MDVSRSLKAARNAVCPRGEERCECIPFKTNFLLRNSQGRKEDQNLLLSKNCEDDVVTTLPDKASLLQTPAQKGTGLSTKTADNPPITYHTLDTSTQNGQPQLVDSLGHTYTLKHTGEGDSTYWECSFRGKTVMCNATVTQCGGEFTAGLFHHCHPHRPNITIKQIILDVDEAPNVKSEAPVPGGLEKRMILDVDEAPNVKSETPALGGLEKRMILDVDEAPNIKSEAPVLGGLNALKVEQADEPETTEMDRYLLDEKTRYWNYILGGCVDRFWLGRMKSGGEGRAVIHIEKDFIPCGFLRADIRMSDARHILLFSAGQEALLGCAETLYLDKTFKIVCLPLEQIFSIHAFVKVDGCEGSEFRHVPLAFCLMSHSRRMDYVEVLRAVNRSVPSLSRSIKAIVMDFDVPMWQAAQVVFGMQAAIRGCVYHWSRAVWDVCRGLQLRELYGIDVQIRQGVQCVMALPFLPAKQIREVLTELMRMPSCKPSLTHLLQYIERTWILGFWTPEDWSTYGYPVRSEVNVEGWTRRMCSNAGRHSLPHHELIMLLYEESQVVGGHQRIAKKEEVIMEQRKAQSQVEELFVTWQKFEEDGLSASLLLSVCSRLKRAVWEPLEE